MESTFWSSMLPMLCILWNIWARRWLGGILSKEEVGVDYELEPPVPIPNTEVKQLYADNTWLVTAREDT